MVSAVSAFRGGSPSPPPLSNLPPHGELFNLQKPLRHEIGSPLGSLFGEPMEDQLAQDRLLDR